MARTAIRIGLVGLSLASAGMCTLLIAGATELLHLPDQRVGLILEFPESSTSADEVRAARACLPRLLTANGARKVVVTPRDASTIEVEFHPVKPWSEKHGLRADGYAAAPELLPDDLRTLLTAPCDLRFLQVVEQDALGPREELDHAHTAAFLEGRPDRRIESLRTALHIADAGVATVAWCPLGSAPGELLPLRVAGRDQRVTCADLAGAWHTGAGDTRVELWVDDERSADLNEYLDDLVGHRLALVVDGTVTCVTRVVKRESSRLVLGGDLRDLTSAETNAIVSRITQPLLPVQPRITRAWITHTHSSRSGRYALVTAGAAALVSAAAAWAFVRDVRHRAEPVRDLDWSSGA